MNTFVWVGLYDRGDLKKERLHFKAITDMDLKNVAVYDSEAITGTINVKAGQRTAYWFEEFPIKTGENFVLYTRAGTNNSETREDGSVFHFRFRGATEALYASETAVAIAFQTEDYGCDPDSVEKFMKIQSSKASAGKSSLAEAMSSAVDTA